jgi:hypothetical protein
LRSATPPQAPAVAGATRQSLVMSNQTPIVMSQQDREGNFVFQKDSAGLGVPRGSLGNLNHVANDVGRHGSASMPVYAAAPNGAEGNSHAATRGPATLRPAYGGEGSPALRGTEAAAAGRQGGWERTGGVQGGASPSYHGGGGAQSGGGAAPASAPAGGAGSGGGGASRGPVASPK